MIIAPLGRSGAVMITVPELAADALGKFLASYMKRRFGSSQTHLVEMVPSIARIAHDRSRVIRARACVRNDRVTRIRADVRATFAVPARGRTCAHAQAVVGPQAHVDLIGVIVADHVDDSFAVVLFADQTGRRNGYRGSKSSSWLWHG